MNLRDKLQTFVLTKQEQRTIAFIVLMLALGLATKHYRATHPRSPNEKAQPIPTQTSSPPG